MALHELQFALQFRAVSFDHDEALCIATMLDMDVGAVAKASSAVDRMLVMWRSFMEREGGIPARTIFWVDDPIPRPGWRWSPRTLLGSNSDAESILSAHAKSSRFYIAEGQEPHIGRWTSRGLHVCFDGYRLVPVSWQDGADLHLWRPMLTLPRELGIPICVQTPEGPQWLKILDAVRSANVGTWSEEERRDYDRKVVCPISKEIETGNCALIQDIDLVGDPLATGIRAGILVQIVGEAHEARTNHEDESGELGVTVAKDTIYAHISRRVIITPLKKGATRSWSQRPCMN